jgi:hypothetical protein
VTDSGVTRLDYTALDDGFELSALTYPIVRMRLAEEIHRRAYHDSGVEVVLGDPAPELDRTYRLVTPYCLRGNSVIAELSWQVDQRRLSGPVGEFRSWGDFCRFAFATLGASSWYTRRHLGCFHRRGKAMHDRMFSVMAQLVASGPSTHEITAWTFRPDRAEDEPFTRLITAAGAEIPRDKPSRYLSVSCCGEPLVALRSDGWAVTSHGSLSLDELWRQGASIEQLAAEILRTGRRVPELGH